ncbi:uncharacterized protein LOC132723887 [Ruditapes philippinarum]|uniref:uncharacterized protein LOC132723887 n=1 Tax=Ruditapes philippinarum TaxID=129788 RepID=UPI00295A66BF|nr:uncharacterized protein LOC132723887 [Ruditapes philippinarum]
MASVGSTNASDEIFDFMCRVCKRNGKHCEGEKYCEQCQDYFCLTCVKVHDDIPSLTRHTILDKEHFPREPTKKDTVSKSVLEAPTERCERHSHHFIDMYCQNHDDVGCGTCMAVNHRLCKDIFYIPEYVENKRRLARTTEMEHKLNEVIKSITEQLDIFKREKSRILKSREETLEVVKKFRKEINDRLDELEKASVADISGQYAVLVDIVDKGMTMLETNKLKVKNSLDVLSADSDQITQNFVNIKKSKKVATEIIDVLEQNKLPIQSKNIDFAADIRISSLLKEINALGKALQQVTTRNEDLKTMTSPDLKTAASPDFKTVASPDLKTVASPDLKTEASPNLKTVASPKEEGLYKTTQVKKYCVRGRADKFDCSILTACTMEDGTIILAEGRNNKIKRLNGSTFAVRDSCDMPGKPWQVCSIRNDQVAVSLPRKEKVLFVSLANRMSVTQNISTGFNCHGLAHTEGNLYISDRFSAVYVYNMMGGQLQKFTKDPPRREMSYAIRSLAVTEDASKVFVAGWNNGLIVLDNQGKVVGKFNGPQLDGAWDCHLTGRGSLLMSNNISNNVLQFGLDGKLRGEVVRFTDQNGSYKGLCCNKEMTKMIIGKSGDEIEVYDLM